MHEKFFFFPICPLAFLCRILIKIASIPMEQRALTNRGEFQIIQAQYNMTYLHKLPCWIHGPRIITQSAILHEINSKYSISVLHSYFQYNEIYNEYQMIWSYFYNYHREYLYPQLEGSLYGNTNFSSITSIKSNLQIYNCLEQRFAYNAWYLAEFSILDLMLFCNLAVLDYCSQINWIFYPNLKKWYIRLKSHEDYNFIFQEKIYTIRPPMHFASLDF